MAAFTPPRARLGILRARVGYTVALGRPPWVAATVPLGFFAVLLTGVPTRLRLVLVATAIWVHGPAPYATRSGCATDGQPMPA